MTVIGKLLGAAALASSAALSAHAFDMSRDDNIVGYWGQNSHGASDPSDTAGFQKKLGEYCDDDSIDTFPISFLTVFFGTGGLPQLDLANICNANDGKVFPNSQLPDCSFLSDDIDKCQKKGKIVTLSMGGATGGNVFTSDDVAKGFADQIWDLFLGGNGTTRPFGAAKLDGIDLDIEGGTDAGYVAFVQQLQSHYKGADKKYYVTAAPQCPFPDAILGKVLDTVAVDAVYVQFYNNYCSVVNYADPNSWNYGAWANWTKTAPNPDVKLYIGAPGAPGGANPGSYVDAATLAKIVTDMRTQYPGTLGGAMYWDVSQAVANSNFNTALKDGIRNGDAPAPPPSSAPAPPSSTPAPAPPSSTPAPAPPSTPAPAPPSTPAPSPPSTPTSTPTEDPCPPESTETTPPTSTPTEDPCPPESTETTPPASTPTEDPCPPESTESAPTAPPQTEDPCPPESTGATPPAPTPTEDPCPPEGTAPPASPAPSSGGGDCSAPAWTAADVYTQGKEASYNGHVYTAKWWTQGETPGSAQVWTDAGACSGKRDTMYRVHANKVKARPRATPVARYNPHSKRSRTH